MNLRVVHYSPVWLEQTQTWLFNQINSLPDTIESHIVCRSTRNLDQFQIGNVHCLKLDHKAHYLFSKLMWLSGYKSYNGYLIEQIDRIKPQLIHSHFGNNGWMNIRIAQRYGLPHVVTFYGQDVSMLPTRNPAWRDRYRQLFAAPKTLFLCEGNHMASCLVKLGCDPAKIRIHHLGVAVERIDYHPRQWRPGELLKILIAASFREKKGIPYALEALASIRDRYPMEITLIGDAGSHDEKQRILQTLDRHNLRSCTRLLGFKSHRVFLSEAYLHHLFLSPSVTATDGDTEGGAPVSIIEMAASGMPVISSLHCDIPEVIKPGETGWLAEERNIEQIAYCILQWLDRPNAWETWLDAGRSHIEKEYSCQLQALRLSEHYRSLVN
jgi:colanic acid/amylovoran biosynthesis glycosyltransferase